MKFCANCGSKMDKESKYCPECGAQFGTVILETGQDSTVHQEDDLVSNEYYEETESFKLNEALPGRTSSYGNKKDKFRILLWVIFLPFMLIAWIARSPKLNPKVKGVLIILILSFMVYAVVYGDQPTSAENENPPEAGALTSEDYQIETEKSDDASETVKVDPIIHELIAGGVDGVAATIASEIIQDYDLPIWSKVESINVEQTDTNDYIFTYPATDGAFTIILGYHVLDGEIVEIIDDKFEVVYDENGLNPDYLFYKSVNIDGLQKHTQEVVKSVLAAPSTAKFPGSWMDPYEGWSIGKTGRKVQISSYVDSQNSFGAMIRTDFSLIFLFPNEGGQAEGVYFKLGDQVLINKV